MPKQLKDKTITPTWNCGVINNDVVVEDQKGFHNFLNKFEGKTNLQLVIKRKVKPRSRQEEKYYHSVVVRMVADAMSLEDEEAHDFLKKMFLRTEERHQLANGKIIRYERTGSTTDLGDAAYRQYWQKIQRWAVKPTGPDGLGPDSGLGLYIPDPNEADWEGVEEYELAKK